jgi:predicted DNA-binding transcriptional regulator AlpA
VSTTEKKSAQVEPAQKAAALRAAKAKQPQHAWLRRDVLSPPQETAPPTAPERLRASDRSQVPPRLLDKAEVLAITGVSFPTLWLWMRANKFPRSRVAGGKSKWLSTEIDEWLHALPLRRLKGDEVS